MVKPILLALFGAMSMATAGPLATSHQTPAPAVAIVESELAADQKGQETIAIYYTPLSSTEAARQIGFGLAYHMALVYTDKQGRSFGASAVPSNHATAQTPRNMLSALFDTAAERASEFGTLVAETNNDHPFVRDGAGDRYTHDREGRHFPRRVVARGADLSAQWQSIVATYVDVSKLGLTYSPLTQNSNSLAAEALRRIGYEPDFSSQSFFTPGAFTRLPRTA
jgi:hypothetical protein